MRLRKLTRKSIMGFGYHSDRSVQQVLDMSDYQYIRWAYYSNSHINFFEDILDEVGISESLRIDKPGVDKQLFEELKKARSFNPSRFTESQKNFKMANNSHKRKMKRIKNNKNEGEAWNKGRLAWKNQGHK